MRGWRVVAPVTAAAVLALPGCLPPPPIPGDGVEIFRVWDEPGGPAPGSPVVALTFDDGPDPRFTPAVLDILERYGVGATFFVTGEGASAYPWLVRAIVERGSVIGSHTWSHADLTRLPASRWATEIDGTTALLEDLTGRKLRCLRPPYGARNADTVRALGARGLGTAMWSVDPSDYLRPGAGVIAQRVLAATRPGSIITLHDGGADRSQTVAALPAIIEGLRAAGYTIAPICGRQPVPFAHGVALSATGTGGYVVDGWGQVHAFGGAPPRPGTPFRWHDIVRSFALRPDGTSGYLLDYSGGIHPFGGAPPVSVTAFWPGQDLARDMVLRPDGTSGYVLDAHGGVHPFGGAPPTPVSVSWPGQDLARALVLRPDCVSGYVLDAHGALHPFGGAPPTPASGYRPDRFDARDAVLTADGQSGYVLLGSGTLSPFGAAPPLPTAWSSAPLGLARGLALRPDETSGYVVDVFGFLHPIGGVA